LALLDVTIVVGSGIQHSDLHGENILVSAAGEPVFIDFERVNRLPVPADAVMLELSLALHPAAASWRGDWPSIEQASRWWNVDEFAGGSAAFEGVSACREWARRIVTPVGVRAIAATALAYCLWQVRFPSVDRDKCLAIGGSAAKELGVMLERDMDS
jgi:hypothetical protein